MDNNKKSHHHHPRQQRPPPLKRHQQEQNEITTLERRITEETPFSGTVTNNNNNVNRDFSTLPLSRICLHGLTKNKFKTMTDIQANAIPHALAGRDVLGAAKTGSGKSLAFIVPLLEDLFRIRWSKEDGLGAIILSPTRELASQLHSVLRLVGEPYGYRLALILGGTNYEQEKVDAVRGQVIVGTPGRILHHLEQTPGFDASFVRVLVLDEADRLLDMGFSEQLESVLSYLPRPRSEEGGTRQTLMFSATQTKRVRDLATLSLKDPEFISAHAEAESSTPSKLKQSYMIVDLASKFDATYSFLRTHTQHKIICFFSSCKQVKFAEAALRKLNTGLSILALHGKQKAGRRRTVHERFVKWEHVVLLATDIAARGLDFPDVDWVLQIDCPEDVASYIHRVGRTARYTSKGSSMLFLLPSEEHAFVKHLEASRVPIIKMPSTTATPMHHVMSKLRALLAQDSELKSLAQSAFKGYLRSLHLQPDKTIFVPVTNLPVTEYAASLGLAQVPKLSFLKGVGGKAGRAEVRQNKIESGRAKTEAQVDKWISGTSSSSTNAKNKVDKLLKRVPASHNNDDESSSDGDDDDDDDDGQGGLLIKGALIRPTADPTIAAPLPSSKPSSLPYKSIKIAASGNAKNSKSRRMEFDDDDDNNERDDTDNAFVARVQERLKVEDKVDKQIQKAKVHEKHVNEKRKKKRMRMVESEDNEDNDDEEATALRLISSGRA